MSEVASIAASLTEAQKRAIRSAEPHRPRNGWFVLRIYRDRGVLARSLAEAGLVTFTIHGAALNSAGKRVRQHLLAEDAQ